MVFFRMLSTRNHSVKGDDCDFFFKTPFFFGPEPVFHDWTVQKKCAQNANTKKTTTKRTTPDSDVDFL